MHPGSCRLPRACCRGRARVGARRHDTPPCTRAQELSEEVIHEVKGSLRLATQAAPEWAKAWHDWALFNVTAMEHYAHSDVAAAQRHVAPAVAAFFKSVALGQASGARPPLSWPCANPDSKPMHPAHACPASLLWHCAAAGASLACAFRALQHCINFVQAPLAAAASTVTVTTQPACQQRS